MFFQGQAYIPALSLAFRPVESICSSPQTVRAMPTNPVTRAFRAQELSIERPSGLAAAATLLLCAISLVSLASCAGYTSKAQTETGGTPGVGVLTPSPASVPFGSVAVGSTSVQSVSVTNTGTGTVDITGAGISGGVFTVVGGAPSNSLAAGQSATVQVQFAPTSMTPASGTLTVTSDASNPSLAIGLTGTGLEAVPAFSPSSLNFNNVTVGQTSSQNVTLTNNGNTGLVVTNAAVSGAGFGITNFSPLPKTIAANGGSATFGVTFTPASTNGASGQIVFTDNAIGLTQTFTMTGSAVAAGSTLGANPGSFNFNNVVVGTSSTQNIVLMNSGTTAITVGSVVAAGAGFSASGIAAQQQIAGGASATLTAQFAPTGPGAVTGTITVNSNATNNPLVISLSGTGTQAALSANPSSINFGSIIVGNTSTVNVTLTNTGTASLNITSASASGPGFSMSTLAAQTLVPLATATFTVTFGPTANGPATGSVLVNSTAPGSPLTVGLSGSGAATQAQLAISPSPVPFGSVAVGTSPSPTQTVTLTNTGNATLNITAATLTGSAYSMNLAPVSIAAGSNTTFTVTFTPTTGGGATGNIQITSNAVGSPTTLSLTGTGLQAQISSNPTSVAFGTVALNNTNSQPIILTNNGNATLTFSQISVTGIGFAQTGLSTTTTVAAGAHITFNATFDPTAAGPVTGTITLNTNAASPLAINLTGTGQAQTLLIGANPTTLAFGTVLNGTSSQLTTLITNSGNSTVTISGVTTTGAGFTASGITNGTMLTAGQSATLTVTFAPTQGGAVSGANVSIASNATGSPTVVMLTGTGQHNVVLAWSESQPSGVTYNVFRGTSPGGEGTTAINTSPISLMGYTDTNVVAGTTYYYTVQAVNSAGTSPSSNEASATVPTP
jgi:hypothetical protein